MTSIFVLMDGYWREVHGDGIPADSGIYCVYDATYDDVDEAVILNQLLYVGESADVRARIFGHEKLPLWRDELGSGSELCFSFAPLSRRERERGEAAIVHHHKPPLNEEYVGYFPFPETIMTLAGKTALLDTFFVVRRNRRP